MSTQPMDSEITEGRESGLLHRTFAAEMTAGDGRTIDVRIVPYGEKALVDDGRGAYEEEFVDGAFDGQIEAKAAHRVFLNFEHQRGIGGIVGKGLALRSEPDGLYGSFRALENSDGDKALMLVEEKILDGVSLEFMAKKSVRTAAGVIRRVKAHLDAVALCRTPAYSSAVVLAVREAPVLDEELLPVDIDPELVERCRQLGIRLPQRYEAHPVEADTPADAGTSEDGTRHDDTSTEGGLDA